jgi:flagellin-like protein
MVRKSVKTHGKKLAGISPIISTVILMVVVFSIAAAVSPWIIKLVTDTSKSTTNQTTTGIKCREAAYDFDTSYGTYGVSWSFSTANNTLGAKIKNTGTVTLYNFSFELTFNETVIEYFYATEGTQRTSANPLKPSHSAFINASITKDVNDTLTNVKILNIVCTDAYVAQNF